MRLTHNAVAQFASRWGGDERLLRELIARAEPTTLRTPKGQAIWVADHDDAQVRLVIKWDRGEREPICVTVLARETPSAPMSEGLLECESPTLSAPPIDDEHVAAARAELEALAKEETLATEIAADARAFRQSTRIRVAQAKQRLARLREGAS